MTKLAACLALLLAPLSQGCVGGCGEGYGKGERIGEVYKVSYRGLVFKAYEVEVNLGGNLNSWAASTSDAALAEYLTKNIGHQCHFSYDQWAQSPIRYGSDYVLTAAKCEGQSKQ